MWTFWNQWPMGTERSLITPKALYNGPLLVYFPPTPTQVAYLRAKVVKRLCDLQTIWLLSLPFLLS